MPLAAPLGAERGWAHTVAGEFAGWCPNRAALVFTPCGQPARHVFYDPARSAEIRERIRAVPGG